MPRKDFAHAAKELGKWLESMGYAYHLDSAHNHPRLYVISEGQEQFTILSSTASYDEGNALAIKRQDIERDVLPNLPIPPLPIKNGEDKNKNAIQIISPSEPIRVYSVKMFIGGTGALAIVVPKEAIPTDKPFAQPQLFHDKFGIIFSEGHGAKAANTRSEDLKCFYFPRGKVGFKYATKQPKGQKLPELCARRIGDSLVCDVGIPIQLIRDVEDTGTEVKTTEEVKKLTKGRQQPFSLQDGTDLRTCINKWVDWARNKNMEPVLSVNNKGHLLISIATKVIKDL